MWTVFLFGCERPNANIQFPAMTECPLMAHFGTCPMSMHCRPVRDWRGGRLGGLGVTRPRVGLMQPHGASAPNQGAAAANAPAVTNGIDFRRIDAGTPSQANVDKPISCDSRYWLTAVESVMSEKPVIT